MMSQRVWWVVLALLLVAGCSTRHDINMKHEVAPIHITLDINLKVDRELDDFFGDIDDAAMSE